MATPSSSFLKNRYWVLRHGKSIPNEKGLIVSSVRDRKLRVPRSLGMVHPVKVTQTSLPHSVDLGGGGVELPSSACFDGERRSSVVGLTCPLEVPPYPNCLWVAGKMAHGCGNWENGMLEEYRLAYEGEAEARAAGELFLKDLKDADIQLESVRICYSPFSRTNQTARIVASVLKIPFEAPQCEMIEDLRERYFGPSYELDSHTKYPEIWDLDEKDPFEGPEGGESAADVVSRLVKAMEKMETKFQGCAILVVSHGDPLQMLQNILHAAKDLAGSDCGNLASRMEAVQVPSVLSKHRKFALLTAELRAVL